MGVAASIVCMICVAGRYVRGCVCVGVTLVRLLCWVSIDMKGRGLFASMLSYNSSNSCHRR